MPTLHRSSIWSDPRAKPVYGSVRLDRGHSLAAGLRGAWLFQEGAGAAQDLVVGNAATWTGGWTTGPTGPAAVVGSSNSVTVAGDGTQFDAPSHSMLMIVRSTTASGLKLVLAARKLVSQCPVHWCVGGDSAREGYGYLDASAFRTSGPVTRNIDGDGLTHCLVGTCQGSGPARYFIDGKLDSASTVPGSPINGQSPPNPLKFNSYLQVDDGHFTGSIALVYFWARALSMGEAEWISAEPYVICQPKIRRRYFVPSVSGIVGSAAVTLDALTASATATLALAAQAAVTLDALTATAASALALVGASTVTLADVTSTATGALTLTGSSALTLADATLAAAGTLASPNTGSATITLDPATLVATSALQLAAALSVELVALTATSVGALAITGALTATLESLQLRAYELPSGSGSVMMRRHHHHGL